jgi:4-oxalocrotonate tautomerase
MHCDAIQRKSKLDRSCKFQLRIRLTFKTKLSKRSVASERVSIDQAERDVKVPLVRIDLIEGKSEECRARVGDIVYQPLVAVLNVPEHDRFHVITEHPKSGLPFDHDYLGIHRTDECVFLQITLNAGRSTELKQRFYKELADRLRQGVKFAKRTCLLISSTCPKRTGHLAME